MTKYNHSKSAMSPMSYYSSYPTSPFDKVERRQWRPSYMEQESITDLKAQITELKIALAERDKLIQQLLDRMCGEQDD
tara:strand:- start:3631 stop:3864 length:234 start_codon:yes stop_codon:yes gene_type:complete